MASRRMILLVVAAMLPTLLHAQEAGIPLKTAKMFTDACSKSENPDSCLSRLSLNPKASSTTNIKDVVSVALAAVAEESHKAQDVLRQAERSNPEAVEALKACRIKFGNTILDLVVREGELEEGASSLNVHYALDYVLSCESSLAEGKFVIPALEDEIRQWKDIYHVAYAAVMKAEDALHKE